jgi:hypothetical protein
MYVVMRWFISWGCLLMLVLVGCQQITLPQASAPAEVERTVPAPFDVTWEAVLEVVKQQRGTVITTERASGLIVYRCSCGTPPAQLYVIYVNVLLKPSTTTQGTVVYVMPQRGGEYAAVGAENQFFNDLSAVLRVGHGG